MFPSGSFKAPRSSPVFVVCITIVVGARSEPRRKVSRVESPLPVVAWLSCLCGRCFQVAWSRRSKLDNKRKKRSVWQTLNENSETSEQQRPVNLLTRFRRKSRGREIDALSSLYSERDSHFSLRTDRGIRENVLEGLSFFFLTSGRSFVFGLSTSIFRAEKITIGFFVSTRHHEKNLGI